MHKFEILKMRAEFAKDDNGTIWFMYATKIFAKKMENELDEEQRSAKISYLNREHQAVLLKQLKEHRL